jgi:hypothetical protein
MKTFVAAVSLAALIASPALAQTATQRARAQQSQVNQVQTYDRAAGRERTCGYAEYQYDSEGTPMGPYCH